MKKWRISRIGGALLTTALLLTLAFAQPAEPSAEVAPGAAEKPAPRATLRPTPADGRVAYVTASLLARLHYSQHKFDDEISSKFLDRYLSTLDPQHLHFIQADLEEFEAYRTRLDDLTLRRQETSPAYDIFNRFYERLEQRVAYVEELLKTEKFNFDTDERFALNRRDLPYPKDLREARQLWRDRLRFEYLQEKLNKEKPEEIVKILTRRAHRTLRMFADWASGDVLQIYLTALAHVYDPHSDYFDRSQMENFAVGMSLSLEGIGAELTSPDGYCTIRKLVPGGPAAKSGKIKEKDRIVAVAQADGPFVDVVDMNLNKVVQLIRGPKGTEVRLTIIPADAADSSVRKTLTLVRDEIKLEDQEAKAKIIDLPDDQGQPVRIGVIDLPSFYSTIDLTGAKNRSSYKSTVTDVARLLKKFNAEQVRGVILDLRRNGGGSLEEAVRLTGLFIKDGPVVQVRDADGTTTLDEDKDPSVQYAGPLVVLTSRLSASASEIVAAALQDYGRALVVGDAATHGKGTVQSLNQLRMWMLPSSAVTNDPGALKLTIRKFYRANGESTQLKGVVPDVVLPSVLSVSTDIGESALENPLPPGDPLASARFDRVNLVAPFRADLLQRSQARVAASKDFGYVREDIEQFRKLQADKSVSLNEAQRLREKEEAEARQKAREQERLARHGPEPKIYELTLRHVDEPGLPAPLAKTNGPVAKTGSGTPLVLAGASTNAAAAAGASSTTEDLPDDEAAAENQPPPDFVLQESERILVDYHGLFSKSQVVTASAAEKQSKTQ